MKQFLNLLIGVACLSMAGVAWGDETLPGPLRGKYILGEAFTVESEISPIPSWRWVSMGDNPEAVPYPWCASFIKQKDLEARLSPWECVESITLLSARLADEPATSLSRPALENFWKNRPNGFSYPVPSFQNDRGVIIARLDATVGEPEFLTRSAISTLVAETLEPMMEDVAKLKEASAAQGLRLDSLEDRMGDLATFSSLADAVETNDVQEQRLDSLEKAIIGQVVADDFQQLEERVASLEAATPPPGTAPLVDIVPPEVETISNETWWDNLWEQWPLIAFLALVLLAVIVIALLKRQREGKSKAPATRDTKTEKRLTKLEKDQADLAEKVGQEAKGNNPASGLYSKFGTYATVARVHEVEKRLDEIEEIETYLLERDLQGRFYAPDLSEDRLNQMKPGESIRLIMNEMEVGAAHPLIEVRRDEDPDGPILKLIGIADGENNIHQTRKYGKPYFTLIQIYKRVKSASKNGKVVGIPIAKNAA